MTDTTINHLSNHSIEHKLAAYRYFLGRMLNFPLNHSRQHREWQTILHIAKSNNFPTTLLHKLKQQIQHKITRAPPITNTENNTKWATFIFSSPHIHKITNLFKHTNIKIGFRCHNTTAQLTKPATVRKVPHHSKRGIYQLTCKSCNLSYVGQTSHSLKIRFQQHLRYIRSNNPQSAYTHHILHNQHEYGTMNNLMTPLKPLKYKNMLIPYEQFYIQSLHQAGKLIPEQYPVEPNPLFQLAIHPPTQCKKEPVEQHPGTQTHNWQPCTGPRTCKPNVCTSLSLTYALTCRNAHTQIPLNLPATHLPIDTSLSNQFQKTTLCHAGYLRTTPTTFIAFYTYPKTHHTHNSTMPK